MQSLFPDLLPVFIPAQKELIHEKINLDKMSYNKISGEFWTHKQRQGNSIHEVSYRACFKPQLPKYFIDRYTIPGDVVYDPFSGRGTTIIEAALSGRNVISNDINPLSRILCEGRLCAPDFEEIRHRVSEISISNDLEIDIDLSMFYHPQTLREILSLRDYLYRKQESQQLDSVDKWIQMVATNRLTGHSAGFFSVYTLPPNQAVSQERQIKINTQRNQQPEYKDVKSIILKKSQQLLRDIDKPKRILLQNIHSQSVFLSKDADDTSEIETSSVQLTVTSPPFLDIVQYAADNWLRCWFNHIDTDTIASKITMSKKIGDWEQKMFKVFKELFRITKSGGYVAFEVGEIRNGTIKLEEHVVEIGVAGGFSVEFIMINEQTFTKTANIWGVKNNQKGTNSNRIVVFKK